MNHLTEHQISQYSERRLPPEELLEVDDHMVECEVCREAVARLLTVKALCGSRCLTSRCRRSTWTQTRSASNGLGLAATPCALDTGQSGFPTCVRGMYGGLSPGSREKL